MSEEMPDRVTRAQKALKQAVFATIEKSEPLRVMQVQSYNNLSLRASFQALLILLIRKYGISKDHFEEILSEELEGYAKALVEGAGMVTLPDGTVADLKSGKKWA